MLIIRVECIVILEHGCKEFRCKQREFCVSADLTCDSVDHCADGSDEDTAALCPGLFTLFLSL